MDDRLPSEFFRRFINPLHTVGLIEIRYYFELYPRLLGKGEDF